MSIAERIELRQQIITAWQLHQDQKPVTTLQQQIIDVIIYHPEYHTELSDPDALNKDYSTDSNPFMHISLHMGVDEQLRNNRPAGIIPVYQQLMQQFSDAHTVSHLMMETMAAIIWDAQQSQTAPCEKTYLQKLTNML